MEPRTTIDYGGLAALVRGHREGRGLTLRQAASECGISASTLSRIERREARPDLDTVRALVDWVGVPLERVAQRQAGSTAPRRRAGDAMSNVEIQFRADPNLKPETAEALISIVRAAYSEMVRRSKGS